MSALPLKFYFREMLWTVVFICLIHFHAGSNEVEIRRIKPRIIGGHRIDIKSRPFMISLHNGINNFQCGGSILSKRWAVTALHCFNSLDSVDYHVRAGSNYTNQGGRLHRVKEIHVYDDTTYPHWSSKIFLHDIAIFKVTPPFRFSSTIRPVLLPEDDKRPRRLYVSGWGFTSFNHNSQQTLMTVRVPYVPFKTCVNSVPLYKLLVRRDRHLCYGKRGKDSCYGDSGGPLADSNTIYGIVSFGHNCAEVSGVYAKISYYREWIKIITKL